MKQSILLLFFGLSTILSAQQIDYNTKNGFVAEGYDVVSYFNDKKPVEGNNKFITIYDGAKFRFSSEKHLKIFTESPKKYVPQYGGYCAYAVAEKNTKMYIDGEAYEIRDGKLYLFYTSFFGSKLEDWQEGNTPKLQVKADKNWKNLKHKKN
ncbi:MAG: YHS domain-containing (seleno)protein [Polaribacter sp.]|uniref:YHS domain-containing (seleno)protein n=1 Tax=Polaribacter sp. TaxID=1920175 RepID=UPI003265F833